jgi:integrase
MSTYLTSASSLHRTLTQRRQRDHHQQQQRQQRQQQQHLIRQQERLHQPLVPESTSTSDSSSVTLPSSSLPSFPSSNPNLISSFSLSSSVLRDAVLAPGTTKCYKRALNLFITWCDGYGGEGIDTCLVEDLDRSLCIYIEHLYHSGGTKTLASNTLNAVQFYAPRTKSLLPESHLLVRGWNRLVTKVPRVPLTFELTICIAISMLKAGLYHAAVATLLAFDCYLRVGELCGIRVCDVALTSGRHFGDAYLGSAIGLPSTKTGTNQHVKITIPLVESLVSHLVTHIMSSSSSSRETPLFNFTSDRYRKWFHAACDSLGLSRYNFTPHCLRHGAATYAHLRGVPMEEILYRGRWRNPLSARIYIQSGPMLLIQVHEPTLQTCGSNINKRNMLLPIFNYYRLHHLHAST